MAELDPNASFEAFKQRALEGIAQQFPVDGRDRSLVLDKLEVKDNLHPDDIRSQYRAKTEGATWSVPVYAHLTLKDKATGKALDQKSVRVAELPKMTKRYSYIVNGQEVQVDHQWQLKPGAYTRRRQSGELETRFQVGGNKPSFDITFDPASKQFRLEYGKTKSKIPLYPLVKEMGIGDDQLERLWGKEILQSNQDVRNAAGAVAAFYKTTKRQMPPSDAEAHRHLVDTMRASTLRPDSTEITLGKGFEHVTGDALAHAGKKLLAVQSGEPEDDRDSVVFKDLRGTGDYAYDKLMGARFDIKSKFARRINKATTVRDVVKFEAINKPIQETFTKNQAAQYAKQINPVEMLSSAYQTTVMGEGGIKSERQVLDAVKNLNASHLGFIDPAATPEGGRTGITLRIPMGAKIDGREPKVPLYNLKTQKIEYVGPQEFISKKVVLPDQVKWEGGKPVPLQKQVKIAGKGNEIQDAKFQEADYVLRHPSQLFNPTTNLIPFLNNNSGGRATMATRHIEQAISLVDRTAPLVQVATPSAKESSATFESLLGNHVMAHQSPVDGVVKQVKNDSIVITSGGKEHEVQLYRNYPLNDSKSVLDSTALVKPGDKVKSGQVVADTNFTKGGKLALGRDLKIAYIPYRGLNFEDAYVISEAAAQKLSSLHLHKPSLDVGDETVLGKKMFLSQRAGSFTKNQLESIGDDGFIRIGSKVNPGDPLVLALQKTPVQRGTGLAALRKSFGSQHADRSLTWEGETAGEVVALHKSGDSATVHVRTVEPVQIGDKLSARHANKGIVAAVLPVDQMPKTRDGTPMEVLMNPLGVGGRVNPGQLLETAASKIARKTGKPYVVENFSGQDQLEKVKRELKQHGLSDTDELHDPVTGLSLGQVLTGDMHMLKLHHQVDKKIAVRSGMSLPGQPAEKYDINMQPAGGGEEGGQSMDTLGHYALLARGAKANIREMQTFKSEGPDMNQDPNKRWGSQHHDIWDAIQHGDPLPTPRPTFAFNKFTSLLKAAGVNVEKKGNEFIATPLTDKQIKELTGDRALPRPDLKPLYAKIDPKTGDPKPVSGSLFDEKLTGGHGGFKWSRIDLAEPLPNPLFESSIRALMGLSGHDYNAIISGEKALNHKGAVVELGKGVTGGQAIHDALARIDVHKELESTKRELASARMDKANPLVKKVKYLQMLQDQNLKPQDAYVLHHLPVIPPVMRPISLLKDGNLRVTDINQLYNNFAEVNGQLKDPTLQRGLTEQAKRDLRKNLYDGAAALMGIDKSYSDAENKGLLHQISGKDPKCFDGRTEVLTRSGWVRLATYDGVSDLAAVELPDCRFVWQRPVEFTVKDYRGKMFRTSGRDIDLFVTPNHSHVLSLRRKLDKHGRAHYWTPWERRPADLLKNNGVRARMLVSAKLWDGCTPRYNFDGFKPDPYSFAEFVGWWVAEGWIGTGGSVAYVCQSNLPVSAQHRERIDFCFEHLGIPYSRRVYKKGTPEEVVYWSITNRPLCNWLAANCGSGAEFKSLSSEVLDWGSEFLRELLICYLAGDGEKRARKTGKKETYKRADAVLGRFATVSRRLVDDLQHLCAKIGLRAITRRPQKKQKEHHKLCYRGTVLGFFDTTIGDGGGRTSLEDFSGKVYGPTVPAGTLIVRRNGIPAVSGNSGMFQSVLIKRKQDMSMRGVVIPEPSLGLDEIGLPKQHALKLMAPFVVHQLKSSGVASSVIEAQGMVAKETPQAIRALERVVQDRPVLVKRDPVLHKYSIQAFKPKLVEGHTVKVHPLVTSGFNMDFDGDAVSIFVPISEEARREAVGMMPSNNLFSDAHGKLVYQPTLESALGLYKLSLVDGKQKPRSFKSFGEAVEASRAGKLNITHPIQVGDQKTTVGRVLMSAALPQPMQKKILSDLQLRLDRGGLDKLLTQVAKEHKDDYGTVVNKLKNMGNGASFGVVTVEHAGYVGAERLDPQKGINIPVGAHTLSLADITPDKETRDHVLAVANKKAAEVEQKPLSRAVKNQQLIQIYSEAGDQMKERHLASHGQNPTNLLLMAQAKTKPSWDQYKQMTLAPMLVEDTMGRLSPKPITKTFAEGLDVGQYWQQMAGARRGAIMKVQEVREPGYLTKLLNASSMDTLVTGHDCGAQFGAHMYATDREAQDRYLAQDYHHKDQHLKAGILLTPQVLANIRAGNKEALLTVRSPLRCENEKGICQKCMGLASDGHDHQIGTNVGVLAAQTLGERAVQLTLKHFHTGGAVSGGKSLVGDFTRFKQLAHMPEQIPNEAVLATTDGTVEKIEPDRTGAKIWIGGKQHHVAKDEEGAPLWKPLVHNPEWRPPRVGDKIRRGALLSDPTRSIVNPRDLYAATGSIEKTKDFLADEMYKLYEGEGVKRKHVEVLVKNLTNLTQIQDPAGQDDLLRGELQPQSRIAALNRKLQAEGKPTVQHKPVLKELTVLPLSLHEDWIAKLQYSRLRNTIMDAAATGAVSNIHSSHPIPAMAFGAEFGLTSEDAKKRPSLKHLESVPQYSY